MGGVEVGDTCPFGLELLPRPGTIGGELFLRPRALGLELLLGAPELGLALEFRAATRGGDGLLDALIDLSA